MISASMHLVGTRVVHSEGPIGGANAMAILTRAEEFEQTMDRDAAFRAEREAALTVPAKKQVLNARGCQGVQF